METTTVRYLMRIAWFGAICWTAGPTWAAEPAAAAIVNSGSTNTASFRIVVERSGKTAYTESPRGGASAKSKDLDLPADLARRFYADLEAARPFSGLPNGRCMKSASFGATLKIEFDGQSTPDLSCGDRGNARLRALIQDSDEIVKASTGK